MRVLLMADVVGGVRTFVAELAGELAAREVELHLALIGPQRAARELAALPVASCAVRDLPLEWMPGGTEAAPELSAWLGELGAEHRPDVLHLNTFTPVPDPEVPVLLAVHSCVLSWWRAVHGVDAPAQWEAYRALAAAALRRAQLVLTPSGALLAELEAIHGPLPPARVVPNGTSVPAHPPVSTERLVVSVGRLWDEAKNVAALAAAAPLVDGRTGVIGAGSAPGLHHLGELAHAEVLAWLRRARVFAEPARYEPFGLAALEAARCGCALVLGDIPSLREVWGDAATYVSPDDPGALARAVNRLLDDPEPAAQAAGARAERYTVAAMAQGHWEALRSVQRVAA